METMLLILSVFIGALVGYLAARKIHKNSNAPELDKIRHDYELRIARIEEQLAGSNKEFQKMEITFNEIHLRHEETQRSLLAETKLRVSSEERATQIPNLQQVNSEKQIQIDLLLSEVSNLKQARAQNETRLEEEKKSILEQKRHLEENIKAMQDSFKALSSDTLKENNKTFLELATQSLLQFNEAAKGDLEKRQTAINATIKPINDTLEKFDLKIADIERSRIEAYSSIKVNFEEMSKSQERLKAETANLVKALRTPQVKGRWGEMQLKRVVEMAGMVDHCDFVQQETAETEEGRLRPDMVVKLPGAKNIIVDSKAVITAYIDSSQSENEEEKRGKLLDHARHIKSRVAELSKKAYWDQFANSPEFVVLFLPGESFFSAALEVDPSLIEQAVEQKVIIATPTTLIALLKAVSYGWKQAALAENATMISDLGKELYKRINSLANHFETLGSRLSGAVDSYNKTLGALESRVLVSARQFNTMKVSDGVLEIVEPIQTDVRELSVDLKKIANSSAEEVAGD